MRLFRHYTDLPPWTRGAVVALGNFDGVHRGHRAVIGEAQRIAREFDVPLAVLTLEPHPLRVLAPETPPFRLSSLRSKAHRLDALGVDILFALHFDRELAGMLAQDFVTEVLMDGLGACHLVVGYDFVFGHRRAGDPALLGQMAEMEGFGLTVVPPVGPAEGRDGHVYSSTRIRDHLRHGRPREAAELLGHWWEVESRVLEGDRRGRRLGFPTANLTLDDYVQPAHGVYAVRMSIDEEGASWRDGIANFGRRPTFGKEEVLLEVHLFDFTGDLYGRHVRVAFIRRVRGERRFDGPDALKAQIAADCEAARDILADPDNRPDRFAMPVGEAQRRLAAR